MTTAVQPTVVQPKQDELRLVLPAPAVRRLKDAGIYCERRVTLERRKSGAVLHAEESGGATKEIGQYILFATEKGEPIPWLQPIQSIIPNGRHAVVVADAMVSVEMFRFQNSYELLIVRHSIADGHAIRKQIFRGIAGYLPLDLTGDDAPVRGSIVPEFFTRAGERRELPSQLLPAFRAATAAVNVVNVQKPQFAVAPQPKSENPADAAE